VHKAIDRRPQPSTSSVLNMHGATGYPQVIHNLWGVGIHSPAGWSALPPEPVLARKQAHRAERFTGSSGIAGYGQVCVRR
jgi:hypothetical protein